MEKVLYLLPVVCILISCSTPNLDLIHVEDNASVADRKSRKELLSKDLATMLGHTNDESLVLAEAVFAQTDLLSREYGIQTSARIHNFLVHIGLKDRGLCCHWVQDMFKALRELDLKEYEIAWAVSRHGSFQEHNSVVVVVTGKAFETGIVLDPWRFGGELHWAKVSSDHYQWQVHPYDDGTGRVECEIDQ